MGSAQIGTDRCMDCWTRLQVRGNEIVGWLAPHCSQDLFVPARHGTGGSRGRCWCAAAALRWRRGRRARIRSFPGSAMCTETEIILVWALTDSGCPFWTMLRRPCTPQAPHIYYYRYITPGPPMQATGPPWSDAGVRMGILRGVLVSWKSQRFKKENGEKTKNLRGPKFWFSENAKNPRGSSKVWSYR